MSWLSTIENDLAGATGLSAAEQGVVVGTRFFEALVDGAMWRSLGWLILGIMMMGVGVSLLMRGPVNEAVGNVAKIAAVA
jgi:hypothetical protein